MGRAVNRGEVRLYRFAAPDKRRPVVVLTRTSALRYLTRVTIAPITTNVRGIASEIVIGPEDGMREVSAVSLDNIQTVRKDDLGPIMAVLSNERMRSLEAAVAFALGFDER
ncbi:MAG: type II toxin-antitoxin system PemK/MazF family toxin [Chloroflexi bacterium]|nr:type II toxin-antitoxin system PemK/MazF family toxin [Chloroflexota bacterium]PWB43235.1 MAG: PemK family transcriptional regulator [Dehalococcoidia bacterium]